MSDKVKIKVIKKSKMHEFGKPERFAVVRKHKEARRYYCNFKMLYADKSEAETEALRLANTGGGQFYVIEVQSISSNRG